ncbi:hypothetical protein Tco_0971830 [Tanacetum coccineum]
MIKLKLESEEESTMALELIRFIKKVLADLESKNKNAGSEKLIDVVLPPHNKWNEELSIPEQTATGKGTSNPLMAGSLPKTTKPT